MGERLAGCPSSCSVFPGFELLFWLLLDFQSRGVKRTEPILRRQGTVSPFANHCNFYLSLFLLLCCGVMHSALMTLQRFS